MEDEFAKQFQGSAAANGLTLLFLAVIIGLKKLCDRPTKCKSKCHTGCFDFTMVDKETLRGKRVLKRMADPEDGLPRKRDSGETV